jgi:hypothetical protein
MRKRPVYGRITLYLLLASSFFVLGFVAAWLVTRTLL